MTSVPISTRLILARRYLYLLRRYSERPMSFHRRKNAFYQAYWAYAAERVGADVRDLGNGLLHISRGRRFTYVRYHHVDLDTFFKMHLVDDKEFVSRLVRELGFVSPRYATYSLRRLEAAMAFLSKAPGKCVVKPAGGSGGKGITTHITSRKRLVEASLAASAFLSPPTLMLEEQQPGDSYRLLYLDGRLLHAVKRGSPTVLGDGVSDIRGLVRKENARRQDDLELQSITELTVDLELRYTLAERNLSLRSVPAAGELVAVKRVSNQNSRRDQSAVTGQVHADYHEFAAKVRERLGAHLIGIDVMSMDISRPPAEAGSAILEINIPAGLHYHEFVAGGQQFSAVGSALLDYLLFDGPAGRKAPPAPGPASKRLHAHSAARL